MPLLGYLVNPDGRRILSLLPDGQKKTAQLGHEQACACAFHGFELGNLAVVVGTFC